MKVVLIGSFRSGTTWLGEVFSEALHAEFNFEPLEPTYSPEVGRHRLRNRYLDPDRSYPDEHRFLRRMAAGRLYRMPIKATGSRNPLRLVRWRFWRRNTLVKLVQGHLLAPYLARHCDARVVFCVRHPCAVIESIARQRWWDSDLAEFADGRNEDLWGRHPRLRSRLDRALDSLEQDLTVPDRAVGRPERIRRTAIRWSLENRFAAVEASRDTAAVLRFEDFYRDPGAVIERVATQLGVARWRIPRNVRRASKTTSAGSPLHNRGASVVAHWQEALTPGEIVTIREIGEVFGITMGDRGEDALAYDFG